MDSLGFTWTDLNSVEFTRTDLNSLDLTRTHQNHRKLGRNTLMLQKEKGKGHGPAQFSQFPISLPDRMYARTNETKHFPCWAQSPQPPIPQECQLHRRALALLRRACELLRFLFLCRGLDNAGIPHPDIVFLHGKQGLTMEELART